MVEACAVTAPFSGDLGVAEVIFYLKSFFHVLNVMHGQTDTSDLTLFYEDLREQSSVMDSSYAVYWVLIGFELLELSTNVKQTFQSRATFSKISSYL